MTDMQPEARATISIHAPHARGDEGYVEEEI